MFKILNQVRRISVRETRRQQMLESIMANPYREKEAKPEPSLLQKQLANLKGALEGRDTDGIVNYFQLLRKDLHSIPTTDLFDGLRLVLMNQANFARVDWAQDLYHTLTHLVYRGQGLDCSGLCSLMMQVFLKLRQGRHMEQLMEFMILNNVSFDSTVLIALFKLYARQGPVDSAEKLLQFCIDRNFGTKLEYFELLVTAYGTAKKPWEAMQVLKRAEEFGYPINSLLERCLHAFAINGEIRGIKNTMKVLRDKNIPMTTGIYNIQILGYKKAGQFEKAFAVYEEMKAAEKSDPTIKPQSHTISMLIDMYAKMGDPDAAGEILKEMIENKQPVFNVYFNSVMEAYRKFSKNEKVLEFYHLMQKCGLRITADTYNILISMYGHKDMAQVDSTLQTMRTNRVPLAKESISIVMKLHYCNKDYEKVREWYGKLKERGMFPHQHILHTMIRTSLAEGRSLKNCLVYYEMAETLKLVEGGLIQDLLLAHLIGGTPLNEAITLFMSEMSKYGQQYRIKSISMVLDYILSPQSFVSHSLHPTDIVKREEALPKRAGLAEFEALLKVTEIPERFHEEIKRAKEHLY